MKGFLFIRIPANALLGVMCKRHMIIHALGASSCDAPRPSPSHIGMGAPHLVMEKGHATVLQEQLVIISRDIHEGLSHLFFFFFSARQWDIRGQLLVVTTGVEHFLLLHEDSNLGPLPWGYLTFKRERVRNQLH